LMADPKTSPALFSAIAALSVVINETRGEAPGHTASAKWPQQRRCRSVGIGFSGSLSTSLSRSQLSRIASSPVFSRILDSDTSPSEAHA
jgi:hypothetical protein